MDMKASIKFTFCRSSDIYKESDADMTILSLHHIQLAMPQGQESLARAFAPWGGNTLCAGP